MMDPQAVQALASLVAAQLRALPVERAIEVVAEWAAQLRIADRGKLSDTEGRLRRELRRREAWEKVAPPGMAESREDDE